jgi:hypothetical protein
MSAVQDLLILGAVVLVVGAWVAVSGRKKTPSPSVVTIQEGRPPGQQTNVVTCPNCG